MAETKTTKKRTCKKTVAECVVEEVKAPAKKRTCARKSTKKVEVVKKNVLFVASEAWPFAGTGGLGEVIGSLPKSLNELGEIEARVILPLYGNLPQEYREKLHFITNITVPLAWRNQYCGLFELEYNGVTFYFIDNEFYFKRTGLYGYGDDGERFAFLSRAVLELLPYLNWKVDVLHCHDWHTALVPIYYKLFYQYNEGLGGIKTVFTIHNIEYQGQFSGDVIEDLFGIPRREYMSIEHHGCINLMKGAIDYSDRVTTVSNSYAKEIMDSAYAHGLENVLIKNSYKLSGILNGIDTTVYNPSINPSVPVHFDKTTVGTDKVKNKLALQEQLGLPQSENTPMIAMITRLVNHKGLDIVRSAFKDIVNLGVQFVVLGTGDVDHENFFKAMQNEYPGRVNARILFNKDLAQKIYAGADIFLMPSKAEPCGLSQMMALRYGTIPVVRACGGLKDSIFDCGNGDEGNGYVFADYNKDALLHTVNRAVGLYRDYADKWSALRIRAMECDYSWANSAKKYNDFYKNLF
ncbi:MAG: glycogen synthase GlgA [Clostridia bacterium]|nr:glycogen synthase GlgA [Clostridia bacterium]